MGCNINTPSVAVSASTTSAQGTLPAGTQKFIRATNGSATNVAYVCAGANPTATSANQALAPFESRVFERDPNVDKVAAALMASGTAIVAFSLQGEPD